MNLFGKTSGKSEDNGSSRAKPSTWLTLRAIVGGYIAYLGYELVSSGASEGETTMPEWLRICLGVLFMAAGIAVIAYAAYSYRKAYLKEQSEAAAAAEKQEEEPVQTDDETCADAPDSERCLEVGELYSDYIKAVEKADAVSKPTDGLFGIGSDARKSPCHEVFFNDLSEKLDKYAEEGIDQAEAKAIAGLILRSPAEHRDNKLIFPMLFAAAGLVIKLVPFMRPADADKLAIEFSENFPKPERMPAQEKMLRALYDRSIAK